MGYSPHIIIYHLAWVLLRQRLIKRGI